MEVRLLRYLMHLGSEFLLLPSPLPFHSLLMEIMNLIKLKENKSEQKGH